ncbi:MAG: 2-C-methyl-D-erythritol 4-phosphate cytidylyltransferase [Erysipelotrichaceae bacterium]|nr:2-C-methyl-D-erythritol 4-phosphate cytidylyltransferase [Erysipelotrichaceae bacterium]
MQYSAIIVAAGKSERFKGGVNKLLYKLSDGRSVLDHALQPFRDDRECEQIIVVTSEQTLGEASKNPDWRELYCMGGATRTDSVYHGLMAVNQEIVLIHDGARCYLTPEDLQQLKDVLKTERAALLVKDCYDSMKLVEDGYVARNLDRDQLCRAQTPQGFRTEDILSAYYKAFKDNRIATDDVAILEMYSDVKVRCVRAIGSNEKITTIDDIR